MKPFLSISSALAVFASSAAPAAVALPSVQRTADTAPAHVVKVHDIERKHRHYREDQDEHIVDAPFAHVESGREVVVDAPFAHVYVGREGRHIVAPFVDLWVPR